MIILKLNVTKIPKDRIFVGQKGKYLDLVLVENRDGPDQYGFDGFVKIDLNKAARDAGEKGEIVGNWKYVGQRPAQKPAGEAPRARTGQSTPPPRPAQDPDLDDLESIPF